MTRSTISSRRRMAGVATAVLLSLGLLTACGSGSSDSDASGSVASQKAESGTKPSDKGAKGAKGRSEVSSRAEGGEPGLLGGGDSLANHQFQWSVDGATEPLSSVSGLELDQVTEQVPSNKLIPGEPRAGTVTVVRGAERSQQFTDLVDGRTQPATASLSMLDAMGNPTKQYTLQEPRVVKVENAQTGDTQSVTIRFASLAVG
ncbi:MULTISPECIES: hypothetical protein [Streptomyces]|uniref:hypothetical protein n=1 Tax=Streptomyces TaxID=1883 RepID=UPI000F65834E|nr:hypothetical protein [Streptomyces alboflavus]